MTLSDLLPDIVRIARGASRVILEYYDGRIAVDEKRDGSPVTAADRAAEDYIVPELRRLTPDVPVVAEESVHDGKVPEVGDGRFWLVDPLDGTKEFINRNGDFTVNIALVERRTPLLGVVMTPVDGTAWAGLVGPDGGAGTAWEEDAAGNRRAIRVRRPGPDGLTVVASRSHRSKELEDYIASLAQVKESVSRGSALKFCLVARGEADHYPRTSPTMEWDTAAGHALLLAAGGSMTAFDGTPFRYGKKDFLNGWFIATGG